MIDFDSNIDIGLLVLGYCRADLFEKAVRSLECLGLPEKTAKYGVIDGSRQKVGRVYEANLEVQNVAQALLVEGALSDLKIREKNLGTKTNVFCSVTEVLARHEYVFVLEDDLEILPVAKGILPVLLPHLGKKVKAFGIYCNRSYVKEIFLSHRFSSQAWGTSRAAWEGFSLDRMEKIELTGKQRARVRRQLGGDVLSCFRAFQHQKLDSWAVPWNVHNFLAGGLMVYSPASFIKNNSHLKGAERTFGIKYPCELAQTPLFISKQCEPSINPMYMRHFRLLPRIHRRIVATLSKFACWQ